MAGRCRRKVAQRTDELCALVGVEQATAGALGDRDQDREEVLDSPVAVTEQPERLRERVIRLTTNL